MQNVVVVNHPLVQHKLTLMRSKDISTGQFRALLREIAPLMLYEATRDLPLTDIEIETPLTKMRSPVLAGKKLCFVPVLRAGLGFVDSMLDLVPSARVGHIGIYRDPATLTAVEYYLKVPDDIARRIVIVVDPMLATGHSATAAIGRLKELGAETIKFMCLVAAPAGVAQMQAEHPSVPIYTASVDPELNDHAYIVPGLGDAGDRLFGTSSPARRLAKGEIRRSNEEQILRAAERVFARAGFAGARMAEIAAEAALPKANLHYYFKSKQALYRAVLDNILGLWLAETDSIAPGAEPRRAIERYVRAKMRFSRLYPDASRVFANEVIHGAPEIGAFLASDLRALVERKGAVIARWIEEGRMAALDPRHLFFAIWALTQTYADFATQIHAVSGVAALSDAQYAEATDQVVAMVLRGCGPAPTA